MSASQLAYISGARPAADPGNGATAIVAGGAVPAPPGGLDYEPEPAPLEVGFCQMTKSNGDQCGARPVRGELHCVGHKRSLES